MTPIFSLLIWKLNAASDKQEASSEALGASFTTPVLYIKPGTEKWSSNSASTATEGKLFAHLLAYWGFKQQGRKQVV